MSDVTYLAGDRKGQEGQLGRARQYVFAVEDLDRPLVCRQVCVRARVTGPRGDAGANDTMGFKDGVLSRAVRIP